MQKSMEYQIALLEAALKNFNRTRIFLTLQLRTFLYIFVYGGVVFDTDARNVKHKL